MKTVDGDLVYAGDHCGDAYAITPSDATIYDPDKNAQIMGIYVGGTGDVKVDMAHGATGIIYKAVPVGTYLRGIFKKVYATGTTATFLVGGKAV